MSDARYVNLEPAQLARAVERLRFQVEYGLGGDEQRLEAWTRRLWSAAPDHLISLNLLAWHSLPETALPRPPAALTPAARAFTEGRLDDALAEAASAGDHPSAALVRGDLLLLRGDTSGAEQAWREAARGLGARPQILMRLGRGHLLMDRPAEARDAAARALAQNPVYGSARLLFHEACDALGVALHPWPVAPRAEAIRGGARVERDLSEPAQRAWVAWAKTPPDEASMVDPPGPGEPPERRAWAALVEAWRAQGSPADPGGAPELPALDRWEREGHLDAALWVRGLGPATAARWRRWSQENPDGMLRFWLEARVVQGN